MTSLPPPADSVTASPASSTVKVSLAVVPVIAFGAPATVRVAMAVASQTVPSANRIASIRRSAYQVSHLPVSGLSVASVVLKWPFTRSCACVWPIARTRSALSRCSVTSAGAVPGASATVSASDTGVGAVTLSSMVSRPEARENA